MVVWTKFKKDLLKNFSNIDVSTFIKYVNEYLSSEKPIIKTSILSIENLKKRIEDKIERNKKILEERIKKLKEEELRIQKMKDDAKKEQLLNENAKLMSDAALRLVKNINSKKKLEQLIIIPNEEEQKK